MDPKQQARIFYDSLGAADALTCKLLERGAKIQRGRVASLERQITELKKQNALKQVSALEAEVTKRKTLAEKFEALDVVIEQAIVKREGLDKDKFK